MNVHQASLQRTVSRAYCRLFSDLSCFFVYIVFVKRWCSDSALSAKAISSMQIQSMLFRLLWLNFSLCRCLNHTFWFRLSLSFLLSKNFVLRPYFLPNTRLRKITSLFGLSACLEQTFAQRKSKSKSEVTRCKLSVCVYLCDIESHFKDNPALSMLNNSDNEVVYGWTELVVSFY